MRQLITLLVIVYSISLSSCTDKNDASSNTEVIKKELLNTIEQFNTAFKEGNVTTLESMITDSYMHTNGNFKSIRKEDWIQYLYTREKEIVSGRIEVIDYNMEDIEIDLYGTTAIVTGKVLVSSKKDQTIQNNQYRITNVWVFQSGNWKRAAFHDGKIQ